MRPTPKSLLATFIILGWIVANSSVFAQHHKTIKITRISHPIKVDGKLIEPIWQLTDSTTDFIQNFPFDTALAKTKTVVKICFDKTNLYLAGICYDPLPNKPYIIQSLKRDFSYPKTDAFAVYFNPLLDKTNGFNFTLSPLGVQREGLIENGGINGVTTSWDNKWFSEVQQNSNGWTFEMAIPFKTLRYNPKDSVWGINFSRHNLKMNENSAWVRVPRNFNISTLAYTGRLLWTSPPPAAGLNMALIPYVGIVQSYNYRLRPTERSRIPRQNTRLNLGFDGKIALTSALNLDLTVNPDFSQVEVDAQITNLDRFTLFFPERRLFFIENGDLFAGFGTARARPFFSRQIGLNTNPTGTVIGQVPIIGGVRLSGKVNNLWRVGLMSLQTEGVGINQLLTTNYTAIAFQRQVDVSSNIAGILVNKQNDNNYNRTIGLEYNIFSKNGFWQGKVYGHRSIEEKSYRDPNLAGINLTYNTPTLKVGSGIDYIGNDFKAETGFVPRLNHKRYFGSCSLLIYPKSKLVNNHGPFFDFEHLYMNDIRLGLTDRRNTIGYALRLNNYSTFNLSGSELMIQLFAPWDPTNTAGKPLPVGDYIYRTGSVIYESDFRKKFSLTLQSTIGQYFNGHRRGFSGELRYRWQPHGIFYFTFDLNEILLPPPYQTVSLRLLSPKFEFAINRNVFFTLFTQYNSQIKNLNLNARFQWRFAPMSDLFIVITDNYFQNGFDVFARGYGFNINNRAVAIKLNWWLNT